MDSGPSMSQSSVPAMKYGSSESLLRTDSITSSPSISNNMSSPEARMLRKSLKFFFMNPIQKWRVRRQFPFKFFLQVVKIILVTYQLCNFAENRYNHMEYSNNNRVSFSHLFLKNWDDSREVVSYPPEAGPLALYRVDELHDNINFAVKNYHDLSNAIGPYNHVTHEHEIMPVELCIENYQESDFELQLPQENVTKRCLNISWNDTKNFSLHDFLHKNNVTLNFKFLAEIKLRFDLHAVTYKAPGKHCIKFHIEIIYDNKRLDGQMIMSLKTTLIRVGCSDDIHYANFNRSESFWDTAIDVIVILVCFLSMILCIRAIYKAQLLKYRTMNFFRNVKGVELSREGRLTFYNLWYMMIITNDILIIVGSYAQSLISKNEYLGDTWSICSLCLGTGNMLVWFGVLRYFEFFKTYNVVMLTLKCAFPKILRFLLCSLIIYAGYVFCGWLVLGPFHIKFHKISTTSENLFSLINGDDMFATFTILETDSRIVWWYCRIYIYSFIMLFIYVILSLFLSVIIDAYETIKDYYIHGFPKSDLQHFIYENSNEDDDDFLIGTQQGYSHGIWCLTKDFFRILFKCQWRTKDPPVQNEPTQR
ncbi:mucolipin-3-like isoform X2 [Planococcus citri]|uniref:mucolipin-3-like isoform X2 n=1 Tax=Planococcus citri TaxID=170843 RepID=UPI0031F758AF